MSRKPTPRIGKPVSKTELNEVQDKFGTYLALHSDKIRQVVDSLSKYTQQDIDHMALMCFRGVGKPADLAKNAWQILAWLYLFEPHSHPSRQYYIDKERLADLLVLSPESLYMYGLFVVRKPDTAIYEILSKSPNKATAALYRNYCINTTAHEYGDVLVNW